MNPENITANIDMTPNYSKGAPIERSTFNSRGDFTASSCSGSVGVARSNSGTRSTSAAPTLAPDPVPQEPLPEHTKKLIKFLIDLFIINPDYIVFFVKQLSRAQYHAAVVNEILNFVVEKSADEIALISKALLSLLASKIISPVNFLAGIKEILEFAPDIYNDVPRLLHIYDNLGKIIAPQIENEHITFVQIFRLSLSIISAKHGHQFLQAVIRYLKARMRPSFVKSKWQEPSDLRIKQWMDEKLDTIWRPEAPTKPLVANEAPAPAPAPAPVPQKPLPEPKKKSIKYMIDLSIIQWDDVEMVAEVKQLYTAQYHAAVVNEILNIAVEKSVKEIAFISKTLLSLVESNTISPDNFIAGIKEILEFAPDLYIDIPMLYDYLGKIIAPQIEKTHITFLQIFSLSECIISAKHGHLFLKAVVRDLKESMGSSFVKSKWQESGLQIKQWMDEKLVTMWLEVNKFEFLEEDSKVSEETKIILTPAQTQSKLLQLMNADETCECIKGWIQDKIGNSTNEDWFMQALILATCEHALFQPEGRDVPHFNQDRRNKYVSLIHDFVETKQSREADCLFGIQQLIHRLENPQDNEDSQSLKHYINVVDSSAVTLDYTDLSTKVLGASSDSFITERDLTEAKKDTTSVKADDKTRKIKKCNKPNNEEFQSLMINSSNNRRSNEANKSNVLEANFDKFSKEQKAESDTESDLQSQNGDNVPRVTCIDCIFDKELDNRNYHFGNLLIGELHLLPPCMRSEAYVTILRYVDSLKQKHRKK